MKKIFIIAQVKNEADIIESFCRYNLTYSDGMLIRDNGSNDNTKKIIQSLINEGLPIYWSDDVFAKYPGMKNKDAYAKKAIDEYGVDLIIPLDADEFLYHTDGINPRETLESLSEDVEYQIPWRTYVYEKEPDIKLGFMPNNFTQYRNPVLEEVQGHAGKTFISRYLIQEKNAQFVVGAHWLVYPEENKNTIIIENPKKLVCAHFPIRNKKQLMKKIIPNWIYHWHKSSGFPYHFFNGLHQLGLLFKELEDNGELSQERMKDYCIEYSLYNPVNNLSKGNFEKIKKELGDNLLINDKLKLSFCANKLILHYTKYEKDNKSFIRAITTQIDKTVVYLATEIDDKSKLLEKYLPTSTSFVFLDTGNGFNAEEVLSVPLFRHENFFEATIILPPNVKSIRFDPVEGFACIVDNIQVTTNAGLIDYSPMNGAAEDGLNLFDNLDPQILIDFKGRNISNIKITGNMRHFIMDDIPLLSKAKQVFDKYFEARFKVGVLTAERDGLIIERNNLITERNNLITERNNLITERNNLITERNNLINERDGLISERDGILNSWSWRLTRPLRHIKKGLLTLKRHGIKKIAKNVKLYLKKNALKRATRKGSSFSLKLFADEVEILGGAVFGRKTLNKWNADKFSKNVLLVSHELNLTGAPIALYYFAENLKEKGYHPIITSPNDGSLRALLLKKKFPVIVFDILHTSELVLKYKYCFKFLIANTLISGPLIIKLNGTDIPILWWIHESYASYPHVMHLSLPKYLNNNVHIYCGGPYAAAALQQYRPDYKIEQLLYYVPDYTKSLPKKNLLQIKFAEKKCIFAVVGMQEERKGQDILVQAIRMLSLEQIKKSLFIFVGRKYHPPIMQSILQISNEYPQNVQFIEELDREHLLSLYQQIDCLICPSKDDPMPIVVTDAMIMSKTVICSENTGSAKLLEQMNAGLIYRNNSPEELSKQIQFVLENRFNLSQMHEQARKIYECYFSQDAFNNSVEIILQNLINKKRKDLPYNGTVSVIIPTYNAGEEFCFLIEHLKSQIGIGKVEIIIVDSGSNDGTPELAEKLDAVVLRIAQSEFSHSFARNLGAKNATGEYLLFMTQDALPASTTWIQSLMKPIFQNDVVAVSCRETPKPGCDLLGRVSIWVHNEYLGILHTDRILSLPKQINYESIRKNGQLNDVACLIRKDIFMQYLYRGNYSEDLDLGFRLIQSGYQLSLLSSVQVIHSHTRPAIYYLKRSIVDYLALNKILPDYPIQIIDAQTVVNRIITAYCITIYMVRYLIETCDKDKSLSGFFERIEQYYCYVLSIIQNMTLDKLKELAEEDTKIFDLEIRAFIQKILTNYNITSNDPAISADQLHFIINIIPRYLNSGAEVFTQKFRMEITDLPLKLFGIMSGNHLAFYHVTYSNEKNILNELIIEYSGGI